MEEILERDAASEAAPEKPESAIDRSEAPIVYVFDGWGMVPLADQSRS